MVFVSDTSLHFSISRNSHSGQLSTSQPDKVFFYSVVVQSRMFVNRCFVRLQFYERVCCYFYENYFGSVLEVIMQCIEDLTRVRTRCGVYTQQACGQKINALCVFIVLRCKTLTKIQPNTDIHSPDEMKHQDSNKDMRPLSENVQAYMCHLIQKTHKGSTRVFFIHTAWNNPFK